MPDLRAGVLSVTGRSRDYGRISHSKALEGGVVLEVERASNPLRYTSLEDSRQHDVI